MYKKTELSIKPEKTARITKTNRCKYITNVGKVEMSKVFTLFIESLSLSKKSFIQYPKEEHATVPSMSHSIPLAIRELIEA